MPEQVALDPRLRGGDMPMFGAMTSHHTMECDARLYAGHPFLLMQRIETWTAGMKPAMTLFVLPQAIRTRSN